MIKKITLENIKGLKGVQELNFEIKELKSGQVTLENGVQEFDGKKIMMTPTFLGKNASGKSTILEAVAKVHYMESIEELVNEVLSKEMEKKYSAIEREVRNIKTEVKNIVAHSENFSDEKIEMWFLEITDRLSNRLRQGGIEFYFKGIEFNEKDITNFATLISSRLEEDLGNDVFSSYYNKFKNEVWGNSSEKQSIIIEYSNMSTKTLIHQGTVNNQMVQIVDILMKYIDEKIITPIWDITNIISTLLNISTGTYKTKADLDKYVNNDVETSFNSFQFMKKDNLIFNDEKIRKHSSNMFDNTTRILRKIKRLTSADFLSNLLSTIDKNISHIDENKNTIIIKSINGSNLNSNSLSFGTIKIIGLVLECLKAKRDGKSLLLIDEIENGLNQSLIKFVVDFIKSIGIQVIMTTHNPHLFHYNIISPLNALICVEGTFMTARSSIENKQTRPSTLDSIFQSKNYFNKYFWKTLSDKVIDTNTINNDEFNDLLDEVEEVVEAIEISVPKTKGMPSNE